MQTNKISFLLIPVLILFISLIIGCKKDDNETDDGQKIPVLSTTEVTDITQSSAVSGGIITDDGGSTITVRGVCWSTNEMPTINDNKTEDGDGAGSFTSHLEDLTPETTYYVSAYATNDEGTGYGMTMTFTTMQGAVLGTFTDSRDGRVYKTVTIGEQIWMAENLAFAPSSGNYWAYENDDANAETYGYLYDWQTALNACPSGWHLPSDEEWKILAGTVDSQYGVGHSEWNGTGWRGFDVGKKLKATTSWQLGGNSTDVFGFGALAGGYRYTNGNFFSLGFGGYWWSATEFSTTHAWKWLLVYDYDEAARYYFYKELGFSVRCLKD